MGSKTEKARRFRAPRLRAWPALLVGLIVLGAAVLLWLQLSAVTFNGLLLQKLPADSYVAGVARIGALDGDTLKRVAASTNILPQDATAVANAISRSGITKKQIRQSLGDQVAFAGTTHGSLFIFTAGREEALTELVKGLSAQAENMQTIDRNGTKYLTGKLRDGQSQFTVVRQGSELYVASGPELIEAATKETNGFTSVAQVSELSKRLPGASDGYLFYNLQPVQNKVGVTVPLFGLAWVNKKDSIKLSVESSANSRVSTRLKTASGKLLPKTDVATASISGVQLSDYLHLLEEQRQETDLPKVLRLQNGITNLNHTLGINLESEYLAAADGNFVYARYPTGEDAEWLAIVEFKSAATANERVTDLVAKLRAKLTVPVRKEVIKVLPDNTQSREIVAEGRSPLTVADFSVDGRTGQTAALPGSVGQIYWLVDRQYLTIGSSPDAISRALKTTGNPPGADAKGELTVRAQVKDAGRLLADPDVLLEWVLATRPARGHFVLNKANGELVGGLEFPQQ